MQRVEYQRLTLDQKWEFLHSLVQGNKPHRPYMPPYASLIRCKPDYIGPLYINIPFPHYENCDHTTIQLDDESVFCGSLRDCDSNDKLIVTMTWKGYVSQQHDGELRMSPVHNYNNPYIEGVCNGFNFRFEGLELMYGVWPGFLSLYGC